MQIIGALRGFKAASPRFLLVGSYPRGVNKAITTGGCFAINLMREPFVLWPSEIFSESIGDQDSVKHVLQYTRADLALWDIDAVERRVVESMLGGVK